MRTSAVFKVNGVRVGVIGSTVRNTPELVRASATEGLEFLDEAERIRRESAKLRAQGVQGQVVVIHEGADRGANALAGTPPAAKLDVEGALASVPRMRPGEADDHGPQLRLGQP